MLSYFRMLTRPQLHAYFAALGGWTLDAFDFFIFVFCLKSISGEFHTDIKAVAEGLFLTLAFRPAGALVFGWLAEKYGRRPILMLNVISYSAVQLATAFAPNLATLLVLRAVFGFAMGGEWGVGAALALETLPAKGRGFFSGLLQEGYVIGYLLASLLFWCAFDRLGWRGMFIVSSASALLVMYIRYGVEESPAWVAGATAKRASAGAVWGAVKTYFPTLGYLVLLMACFNAFSHGSQDLYPTFLQVQHGLSTQATGSVAMVMNLGALAGGICFGALSERLGRKRAIMLAASLALPMIPLWAWSHTAVMLAVGGFLMQFMVQGAWGIVPAHLNELSPPSVRAILPGFAYQLGNLAMARMGPFQAGIAESHAGDYGYILSWTIAVVAVALIAVTAFGPEAHAAELRVSS
ncbi:MAG TPA: MFS transporter [Steroidobacteraceae bacterium]|jgi:SHS family lactate transporter-like MFS transporter|nr:MFS transporter [Steroidobacteraceae bacterium]